MTKTVLSLDLLHVFDVHKWWKQRLFVYDLKFSKQQNRLQHSLIENYMEMVFKLLLEGNTLYFILKSWKGFIAQKECRVDELQKNHHICKLSEQFMSILYFHSCFQYTLVSAFTSRTVLLCRFMVINCFVFLTSACWKLNHHIYRIRNTLKNDDWPLTAT